MNNIKLVAIDIGGTLLTDNNQITLKNIETLKKIKLMGIKLALITARMYSSTKYISNVIGADYGVFGNGSNIMNLEKLTTYYSEIIPRETLEELIYFGKNNNVYIHLNELLYEVSDENKYFLLKHEILNQNYPENLKSNIKLVEDLINYIETANSVVKVIFVSEKSMDDLIDKLKIKFPNLYISEYNKNLFESAIDKTINYVEIGTKNTNKLKGLNRLINILNVSFKEVLVIGDGDNDINMLASFKNSGCLINGSDKAKQVANYISQKTNNDSGVSEIIEHYVKGLGKKI